MGGTIFKIDEFTKFEEFFADKTIDAIFENYRINFYKIDNFRKFFDFFKDNFEYNNPFRIEENYIYLKNFPGIKYNLNDTNNFIKIIKKIRKKLIEQNYSDEEFKSMVVENEKPTREDYIIQYQNKLSKIKLFLKITEDYSEDKIFLKDLENKNISNIRINNHLENILKGTPNNIFKYFITNENEKFKFGLSFNFNGQISEYEVDTFVLNYDFFNVLIKGEDFIKSKKVILKIDDKNTGKDFITYLYTNKFPFKISIENINRIQSLKTLSNFCAVEDLNQLCDDIIRCIEN